MIPKSAPAGPFIDVAHVEELAPGGDLDQKICSVGIERIADDEIAVRQQGRTERSVQRLSGEEDARVGRRGSGELHTVAAGLDAVVRNVRDVLEGDHRVVHAVGKVQRVDLRVVGETRRRQRRARLAVVDREARRDHVVGELRTEVDTDDAAGAGVGRIERGATLLLCENLAPRLVERFALDVVNELTGRIDDRIVVCDHRRSPNRIVEVERNGIASLQRFDRRNVDRVRLRNGVQRNDRLTGALHVRLRVEVTDDQIALRKVSRRRRRNREAVRILGAVYRVDHRPDDDLLLQLL